MRYDPTSGRPMRTALLTDDNVRLLRSIPAELRTRTECLKHADWLNVSEETIRKVWRGQTFRHVPEQKPVPNTTIHESAARVFQSAQVAEPLPEFIMQTGSLQSLSDELAVTLANEETQRQQRLEQSRVDSLDAIINTNVKRRPCQE